MAMGIIFYLCVRSLSSEPIFIMVLQTGSNDWQELLTKIGIPADSAWTYAKNFVKESITKDSLTMIDQEVLIELGVTTVGHALARMAFSTNCYGFVLCWVIHVSRLCRQAHWMVHSVPYQARLSSCLQN